MNRRLEITIAITIITLFVIIVGKNVFGLYFDESWGIDKLKHAIENQDIKYLSKHLKIENDSSKLSDEDVKRIGLLLKSEKIQDLGDYYNAKDSNIYIIKDGKENIILDKYVLVLKPYKLILESDMQGAEVFMDDKKIGKLNEDYVFEYDSILPGKHKFQLKYKSDYVELEKEDEIVFFNDYTSEVYYSIPLNAQYVYIDSNYPEAKLFVNGKDTGKRIEEIENFGPVPSDGSITLQARLNDSGEVLKSEQVKVDGKMNSIYLSIKEKEEEEFNFQDIGQDVEELLVDLISEYEKKLVHAINNNDFNLVKSCIQKDSPLYGKQKNLVENLNKKGVKEELLDYEITYVEEVAEGSFDMEVYERHKIYYSDGTEKTIEYNWIYTVMIVEGEPLLYDIKD